MIIDTMSVTGLFRVLQVSLLTIIGVNMKLVKICQLIRPVVLILGLCSVSANAGIITNGNAITGIDGLVWNDENYKAVFRHANCDDPSFLCTNPTAENPNGDDELFYQSLRQLRIHLVQELDLIVGNRPDPDIGFDSVEFKFVTKQFVNGQIHQGGIHIGALAEFDERSVETTPFPIRANRYYNYIDFTKIDSNVEVPEPSTLAIFALGMMGLASRRFKKQS